MEHERNKTPKYVKRRRASMAVLAILLAVAACGRQNESPLAPDSPPRPSTTFGVELTHAHFHLPARPVPRGPGML
ncbi:MAG TPA: hypothetical protein VIG66_11280 [Noviherbaspirillum sp.]